ncbi:MAG TPA: beta-ketoacyl-ACP synthase II [Acidimicrobiales bacterium]|nr:beta-ketoacyl-ACP synthase II [Acidimicrobiales bacterium]
MSRRVAVTGMGVKTPAGLDVDTLWSTLLAGRGTGAAIDAFDTTDHPVSLACQIRDFDPVAYMGVKDARRADRVAQLGLAAAMDAIADAGLADAPVDPARCGVIVGTGVGGLSTHEEQERVYLEKGPTRVSPMFVPMMMPNATAALVALQYGFSGPNLCVSTACAAGAHAIGEGVRLIREGSADVVVVGGTEAAITPLALAAFHRMGALSNRADDPGAASRPFDADRDGFVMGEGAAILVLESWAHAESRGAAIKGELLGYGRNCDAHHITAPAPGGAGAVACMQLALEDAGLAPDAVGHVNAHGTSTPLNDAAEAAAISKVFGENTPVTSTKGVTGHLIGAAGAVECVAALLACANRLVPPTANHERTDPEITVDVVAGQPRSIEQTIAISNSFGFGGHNASLIVSC